MDLVAFPAAGTVPAFDSGCASDKREPGKRVEGRVTLGDKTVGTVGAGDGVQRGGALVELRVVRDRRDKLGSCCRCVWCS